MKKAFLRHILPCFLALLLLLPAGLLTSCGGQKETMVKLTNVFSSNYLNIPFEFNYVRAMSCVGDRVYLYGYTTDTYEPILCTMNLDGSDPKRVTFEEPDTESAKNGDFYVNEIAIAQDGSVWCSTYDSSYDAETDYYSNTCYLLHYDADGRLLTTVNTKESFASVTDVETDYINGYVILSDGRIVCGFQNAVAVLSPEGKLLKNVRLDCDYIEKLLVDAKDSLYVVYYDSNAADNDWRPRYRALDTETGTLGEMQRFSGEISPYSMTKAVYDNSKYDFYYTSYGSFYGYDMETQTSTEILNFINCDINSNSVNATVMLDDDTAVTYTQDYARNKLELIVLKRIPDEEVTPKVILKIAALYMDNTVTEAVLNFNRHSDRYRIVIEEYSRYNTDEDYELGQTRLNNDLISGNIPDILVLSSAMPIESYISKGLFADLYSFIDKDETVDRSAFLPSLLKALEVNGKLYELVPSFNIMTVAAKTKFVGDRNRITADELRAVIDAAPQGTVAFLDDLTRSDLLNSICNLNYNQYIDRNTGKCSFDSDSFIKLLELANELDPQSIYERIDWEDVDDSFWEERDNAYRDDRALFQFSYISDYSQYWNLIKGTFGDEISLIGLPTEKGSGSAFICDTEIAMSARSRSKDAVWEFMKYFITEDYQDSLNYNFPVLSSSIDKLAEICMTPPKTDENGNIVYESGRRYINTQYYYNGNSVDIGVIDREHVDRFNVFLSGIEQVYRYDSSIIAIVQEEADAYFNGQRSAKEAAAIIQNRVSLVVNESR